MRFLLLSLCFFTMVAACERTKHSSLKHQRTAYSKKNDDQVTVRFLPKIEGNLALEFRFTRPAVRLTIGEPTQIWAHITNLTKYPVSVHFGRHLEPKEANNHVIITECFCDQPLQLAPKQGVDVSLKIQVLDNLELSEDILYSHFSAKVNGVVAVKDAVH